jgi:OOP family OmpA-OmpF porin
MKQKIFYRLLVLLAPIFVIAQTVVDRKDVLVTGSVTDLNSGKILSNEIVVFKSSANGTEFEALSDSLGKFSLRLPIGTKYDTYILGFHDSTNQNIVLDIPALAKPKRYDDANPFVVPIQFEAPKSFVLDNCNFETGKSDLKPESYKVIDELVEYLNRKSDERIEIGGHTDDVGKPDANMALSLARANTVRAYLLSKGISPDRVTAKGYGMDDPIADNSTAEGRAQNRRTEVKILDSSSQ